MTRLRADLLLLVMALIWGTAFIAQKHANASMGPITFVGARFLLSALIVIPLALYELRGEPPPLSRCEIGLAVLVGICLCVGSILQQTALITTTATNGGFLTAIYVVMVPFTAWLLMRQPFRIPVLAAGVISVAGAWLLTAGGKLQAFAPGDILLLLSDIVWAFSITLVGVFMRRANRPFFLSLMQYSVTAVVSLAAACIFEQVTWIGVQAALPAILYAGILSGGIAFTFQIVAQRYTPPSEAALIMSLESVFAAVAGAILLGERLGPIGLAGCALILLGVVAVEIGPSLIAGRDQSRGK